MGRDELMMLQLFGGGGGLLQGGDWLKVVFLLFLLAVPILWPDRIRVVSMYRRAFVCFALSIIGPTAASLVMVMFLSPSMGPQGGMPGVQMAQVFNATGPVLFGISLIFAMKAVVPGFIPPRSLDSAATDDGPPPMTGGPPFGGGDTELQSR